MSSTIKYISQLHKDRRGSITVEAALMLPMYMVVVTALLFFGWISVTQVNMARIQSLMAMVPSELGSQTLQNTPENYREPYDPTWGHKEVFKAPATGSEKISGRDLFYSTFNAAAWNTFANAVEADELRNLKSLPQAEGDITDPYNLYDNLIDNSFSAHAVAGVNDQGQMEYSISVSYRGQGAYILRNDVPHELQKMVTTVNGWMSEKKGEISYLYQLPTFFDISNEQENVQASGIDQDMRIPYMGVVRYGGARERRGYYNGTNGKELGEELFNATLDGQRVIEPSKPLLDDSGITGGMIDLPEYKNFRFEAINTSLRIPEKYLITN